MNQQSKLKVFHFDQLTKTHSIILWFPVVMHKDKDDNSHHDSHYRARELAALAAYDHQHLDGEMFLQVRSTTWSLNFNRPINLSLL